jgi:hypothetical protein
MKPDFRTQTEGLVDFCRHAPDHVWEALIEAQTQDAYDDGVWRGVWIGTTVMSGALLLGLVLVKLFGGTP